MEFSRQSMPFPQHTHSEEYLTYIQSKATLFQFKIIAPCPVTTGPCKRPFIQATFIYSNTLIKSPPVFFYGDIRTQTR